LEAQKQADEEDKEKTETQRSSNEEEMKERSDESTIHTVPELLMDMQKVCCFMPSKKKKKKNCSLPLMYFFEEVNTFIQQGHVQLIKSDIKRHM